MITRHPVALIVFSNDLDNYLHNIEQERRYIEEALEHYDDTNRLEVITRSSVSIDDIFRLFNRYKGRIAIFHFAGHAGGEGLQLNNKFTENEIGHADGLAQLLGREAKEGQLQLVFLNGCSTAPQVEELKNEGIPSIIGTNYPISDNKAIKFARQLYRSLSNADLPQPFAQSSPTLGQAYKDASSYVQTNFNVEEIEDHRGFTFEVEVEDNDPVVWELFTSNEDWVLPNDETHENKAFNKTLTRRLINALYPNQKAIQKFVQNIPKEERNHWETIKLFKYQAQQKIEELFPWVVGWELRRLFWVGRTSFSESKIEQYLNLCFQTYRITLQLVNYTLLAKLWEYKLDNHTPDIDGLEPVKKFFTSTIGLRLEEQLSIFQTLVRIFIHNKLVSPFPDLTKNPIWQDDNASIYKACHKLHQIVDHKGRPTVMHCFNAEKQLTEFFVHFRFLAGFQLMSMKKIEFQQLRNQPVHYIKDFNILGRKNKNQINRSSDKTQHYRLIRYSKDPSDTYAVIIWKGATYVNLYPFVLDYNALANEQHPKIYFFEHRLNNTTLKYFYSENETYQEMRYQGILEQTEQDTVQTDEQIILKTDITVQQFQLAYNNLFDNDESLNIFDDDDDDDHHIPNF